MTSSCGVSVMKVATLEQQVANLERQRQQEAASLKGSAEHMQREMQGHCTNLQAQLEAFQVLFLRLLCHNRKQRMTSSNYVVLQYFFSPVLSHDFCLTFII